MYKRQHALLLPNWGVIPGAPAGLIAHAAVNALVPLFSTFGSMLILLAILLVGAIVAADEFILELPRRLVSAFRTKERKPRGQGMLGSLWNRPRRKPAMAGGPSTAIAELDEEDEPEWEEEAVYGDGDAEEEEEEEEEEGLSLIHI